MQYILTEEEYQALRSKQKHDLALSRTKLQILCTKIANEMPVKWGWSKNEEAKPWGCTLTRANEGNEWYCDSCPVQEICPNPNKEYSK
jgi:hypothetical protein